MEMKRHLRSSRIPLPAAAGVLALLLAVAVFFGGGDAPLSVATAVATDDCTMLTQRPSRRRGWIGAQPLSNAARTPQNVSAVCHERKPKGEGGNYYKPRSIEVGWDVPSEFPTALLSGYCTLKSHDSGESEEWCDVSPSAPSKNSTRLKSCLTDANGDATCPDGTFYVRVRLKTSCDVDLPWSSQASCSY